MYKVEYLITVDQQEQFCKSVATFNSLVQSIDGVSISNSKLNVGSLSVLYEVQMGEINVDKQHYFHIKLSIENEKHLQDFEVFLKSFRGVLTKANGKPAQVLWDGVSSSYAQMAYPVLHELENTLRKLITKFMLINVGLGWTKETIPKEVSESIRDNNKSKLDHNYLFEVDFIQLSNYLFKEYSPVTHVMLIGTIKKATNVTELDIDELKKSIPRSNWDRFFSSIVNCESDYLRVRWERLYEKRNQVAHNRPISKTDYEEILRLSSEVLPKLKQAIENLDKVAVSEVDREIVSENASASNGPEHLDFFKAWTDLHLCMLMLAEKLMQSGDEKWTLEQNKENLLFLTSLLFERGVFSKEQRDEIQEIHNLRTFVAHHPGGTTYIEILNGKFSNVVRIIKFLVIYINDYST